MQKFYNSAAEPYRELLKMPILGLCTSQIGKPTTVEYLDICSKRYRAELCSMKLLKCTFLTVKWTLRRKLIQRTQTGFF